MRIIGRTQFWARILKIFKCNSAESAGAGILLNSFDIFNDKTLN